MNTKTCFVDVYLAVNLSKTAYIIKQAAPKRKRKKITLLSKKKKKNWMLLDGTCINLARENLFELVGIDFPG